MGGSERLKIRPGGNRFRSLFPRFPEPIAPEFYRFSGKVRALLLLTLIIGDIMVGLSAESLGMDEEFYWHMMTGNLAVLGADLILSLVIWRAGLTRMVMRRLTMVCVFLEMVSVLLGTWSFGSVSSQMIVYGMLLVFVYRAMFDFATGLLSVLLFLGGTWLLVILETSGVLPTQPINPVTDYAYLQPSRQISIMVFVTIPVVLVFWTTNWTVAQLRHKERAIRILRETLAVAEGGDAGRHTGRTLSDTYVVGAVIGKGGMGEVYRGHHRRTRRQVAIKLLHPHLIEDPLLLKRFRREAEIVGRLDSDNIVEIIDVDSDDDQPFLVLELLTGEDLRALIDRQGALPIAEVADIIAQVARGVAAAHGGGVIHRDLKPENIFLSPRDDGLLVKILDFGVSKIRGEATVLTQEIALLGTPDFMSPEQATGVIDDLDNSTDIFALGGLTYYALTGVRPFQATSVPATLRRICDEAPIPIAELRPELPRGVADVITIALAKKRPERYAEVAQFAADLDVALRNEVNQNVAERATRVYIGNPASPTLAASVNSTAATEDGSTPVVLADTVDAGLVRSSDDG